MIKDNHLISAGSVENALKIFRSKKKKYSKFEIEAKSIEEVKQIIAYGKGLVEIVMLDNFKEPDLNKAVSLLKSAGYKIELSGGINKSNFGRIQRKGIDYYSIGMLTHSYKSADFSLEF
jgi:nicotinate-nucleotide pyrophosphorylase (carboxylating)